MSSVRTLILASLATWAATASKPAPHAHNLNARQDVELPSRTPFGFGALATGGGSAPSENTTYIVDNMVDLRTILRMENTPRTVYVKGEIRGNQINETTYGDCQSYIDSSNVPNFNFTLYIMAGNATYTDAVKVAVADGELFEGRNATEYLELLNRQNGWRGTAQNVQKSWESIDARGNLTLIGLDSSAYLNGVSLIFNSRSNIIIRNLRLSPPRDCFPAPETYPATWNARYDAVSFVSTHTAWLDGNIFADSSGGQVRPDDLGLWGWQVDRYDGLFDVEDGSDNITFSHNVVANHHKSLLWGGGEKEGPRDIGKMHFTVFGNRFVNSSSRNPLMRFGTFYIVNNVFEAAQQREPLFEYDDDLEEEITGELGSTTSKRQTGDDDTYAPNFEYHMGIYNMSSVLVSGNYFYQTGPFADDKTRFFTFQNLATPHAPGTFCSPPDLSAEEAAANTQLGSLTELPAALNSGGNPEAVLNMTDNVFQTYEYYMATHDNAVSGGLVADCAKFAGQDMPLSFETAREVFEYVSQNAGQVGRSDP